MLDDLEQDRSVDLVVAQLDAAHMQRPETALIVRGDGNRLQDPLDLVRVEAVLLETLARAGGDEFLSARACGDALGGDTDQAAGAELLQIALPCRV